MRFLRKRIFVFENPNYYNVLNHIQTGVYVIMNIIIDIIVNSINTPILINWQFVRSVYSGYGPGRCNVLYGGLIIYYYVVELVSVMSAHNIWLNKSFSSCSAYNYPGENYTTALLVNISEIFMFPSWQSWTSSYQAVRDERGGGEIYGKWKKGLIGLYSLRNTLLADLT